MPITPALTEFMIAAVIPWLLPASIFQSLDSPIALKVTISAIVGAIVPFAWLPPEGRKTYGAVVGIVAAIAAVVGLYLLLSEGS